MHAAITFSRVLGSCDDEPAGDVHVPVRRAPSVVEFCYNGRRSETADAVVIVGGGYGESRNTIEGILA